MHCYQQIMKFDGTIYQPDKKRRCDCAATNKCESW
jgi:hypothetical protein